MSGHDHSDTHEGAHGSARGYLIGFGLSAILTAIPFWLVMQGVLSNTQAAAVVIVALALVQIVVHTVFFLHVTPRAEGGWTLLALVFTVVMVTIVICGSLWIMYHLHGNMAPMPPDMSKAP